MGGADAVHAHNVPVNRTNTTAHRIPSPISRHAPQEKQSPIRPRCGPHSPSSAPNTGVCLSGELRGKGKGVGRVREGRGKNCWGLIWFSLAPPALHLSSYSHFIARRIDPEWKKLKQQISSVRNDKFKSFLIKFLIINPHSKSHLIVNSPLPPAAHSAED
jgi:hypothetical protein